MFGYAGQLLHVDLTSRRVWTESLPTSETLRFGGGRGINAKLLWEHCPSGAEPLSAENPLILGTGALTCTTAPCSGRTTVTCKSPATGFYAKSSMGGYWGPALKFAGYDHLVIHGAAENPTYLVIEDDHVALRDATHLWGATVPETDAAISAEMGGRGLEIAAIGPAGENLVSFAAVMSGIGNAAARCGVGAVMGSKKLKAIAVRGTKSIRVASLQECTRLGLELAETLRRDPACEQLHQFGTAGDVEGMATMDQLPSLNYQFGAVDGVERISGQGLEGGGLLSGRRGCYACTIACHLRSRLPTGRFAGIETHGPEYETAASLGSLVGVTDPDALIKASALCNEEGLDTISAGGVIAWAMECVQRGVLGSSDLDGLDGSWGNGDTVVALVSMIARRQGFGAVLADGVRRAAQVVGRGSDAWAVEARGLEQSRVDVRWLKAYALSFAVNPRGPDHLHAQPNAEVGFFPAWNELIARLTGDEKYAEPGTTEKRAEIVVWHEDYIAAQDNLGMCMFTYAVLYPADFARYLSAATGHELTEGDVELMGRRTVTAERMFNYREGYRRGDDTLPRRMLKEQRAEFSLSESQLNTMLGEYYRLHDWDQESGAPTERVLADLGLNEFRCDAGVAVPKDRSAASTQGADALRKPGRFGT